MENRIVKQSLLGPTIDKINAAQVRFMNWYKGQQPKQTIVDGYRNNYRIEKDVLMKYRQSIKDHQKSISPTVYDELIHRFDNVITNTEHIIEELSNIYDKLSNGEIVSCDLLINLFSEQCKFMLGLEDKLHEALRSNPNKNYNKDDNIDEAIDQIENEKKNEKAETKEKANKDSSSWDSSSDSTSNDDSTQTEEQQEQQQEQPEEEKQEEQQQEEQEELDEQEKMNKSTNASENETAEDVSEEEKNDSEVIEEDVVDQEMETPKETFEKPKKMTLEEEVELYDQVEYSTDTNYSIEVFTARVLNEIALLNKEKDMIQSKMAITIKDKYRLTQIEEIIQSLQDKLQKKQEKNKAKYGDKALDKTYEKLEKSLEKLDKVQATDYESNLFQGVQNIRIKHISNRIKEQQEKFKTQKKSQTKSAISDFRFDYQIVKIKTFISSSIKTSKTITGETARDIKKFVSKLQDGSLQQEIEEMLKKVVIFTGSNKVKEDGSLENTEENEKNK